VRTQTPSPIALVTGGADGIGWATCRRLAEDGACVAIVDLREEAARERARELGPAHLGLGCDVAREEDVVAAVGRVIAHFAHIDILVNNAGVGEQGSVTLDQSLEGFDRVLAVHLRGAFLMSREVGRVMIAQRSGAIVNISSIAGRAGIPGRNAYGAAKAGLSDGRKIHPAYLFQVKRPAESKSRGDIYKLVATVPAAEAFRPATQGGCPLSHA